MDIRQVTPTFWVSSQITPADVAALAGSTVRSIINDRPDDETPGQPSSADIAATAASLGLGYQHIPVKASAIRDQEVDLFAAALAASATPVLAFCRTGTRAVMLWALSRADHLGSDALIQTASRLGYDISALKPRLDARHAAQEIRS